MQSRFQCPRGVPPRRGHKCALLPPNAVICYESATFANWKTRAQNSDKNEKKFFKKWDVHPSAAIRAPSSASLKKGCLEHSKNAGVYKVSTTLQRETRCAWICSKLLRFCNVFLMKKKVEKSEIEQNICVLLIRKTHMFSSISLFALFFCFRNFNIFMAIYSKFVRAASLATAWCSL